MPVPNEYVISRLAPEWHLIVRFPSADVADCFADPASLVGVATYATANLPSTPCAGDVRNGTSVADWILTKVEPDEPNWTQFRFAPPKTRKQRMTEPVRAYPSQEPHSWPAVIGQPEFFIDPANPRVSEKSQTGRIYAPGGVIFMPFERAAQSQWCDTWVEIFVSPVPWDKRDLDSNKPVSVPVEIDYYGARREWSEALHGLIDVPAQTEPAVDSSGAPVETRVTPAVRLEPTNFQTWAPFTLSDVVTYDQGEGMYVREKKRINPPSLRGGEVQR